MPRQLTEDDFVFMPEADVMKGGGICMHIKNRYWCVHPTKGLVFYPYSRKNARVENSSPQCNSNIEVAKRLCYSWAEVKFIESVLQPIDIQDYT